MPEARALTQAEIDALLNQMPDASSSAPASTPTLQPASGGLQVPGERPFARVIKPYDFRRPDKFSKEQWQTLQSMHDTFARQVGAAFSSRLRALVTVRLSSIEQGLYEEWQSQVPGQTVCYVLAMSPLDGNIVLEFSTDIAAEVIDRLLGGNGLMVRRDRELGEIELVLLRSFASAITNTLEDMWTSITPVQVDLKDIGLDAGLIQVAGANDVVVTALFEISVGSQLGAMSICIPYTVIEPIAANLSAQVWRNSGRTRRHPRLRAVVESLIRRAPLELVAEVGTVEVPVSTVLEMGVGDTLLLDRRVDQPLPLLVDGEARFLGRPGTVGKQVALRIVEAVSPATIEETDVSDYSFESEPEPAESRALQTEPVTTPPVLNEYEEAISA